MSSKDACLLDADDIVGCERAKIGNEWSLLNGAVAQGSNVREEIDEADIILEVLEDRLCRFDQRARSCTARTSPRGGASRPLDRF